MRAVWDTFLRLFLFPGDWISDRLGVTKDESRDLIRMLVNSLLWMAIAIIGLIIWTNGMPMYAD